jgi:hypothetical protein
VHTGGDALRFSVLAEVSGVVVGAWTPIAVTVANPNHVPITITSLRVVVSGSPKGCDATTNFETRPAVAPFTVPARVARYAIPPARRPQIRLRNLSTNQDACKGQTVSLRFEGSVTA